MLIFPISLVAMDVQNNCVDKVQLRRNLERPPEAVPFQIDAIEQFPCFLTHNLCMSYR